MNLLYIRVSTNGQNFNSQKDELLKIYGLTEYKIFEEKASGKSMDRSVLHDLISFSREGDTLVCYDLSRLGRTAKGVLELMDILKEKK